LEYLADIEKANERIEELKELLRIANNDFFSMEATTFDMKSRIAELEAALKPFVPDTDINAEEYTSVWNNHLIQARKALGKHGSISPLLLKGAEKFERYWFYEAMPPKFVEEAADALKCK
jgi:hypothetical protein